MNKLMLRLLLGMVVFTSSFISTPAQFEQIIHKSYREKTEALNTLSHDLIEINNADSAFAIIDQLEKKATIEKDLETQLEARLLRAYYWGTHGTKTSELILAEFSTVAKIAAKHDLLATEARAIKYSVWYNWHIIVNYEMALDNLLKLDELLQRLPDDEFPDKVDCLLSLGSCYHFFGDYPTSKRYFLRAISIKESKMNAMALGSCFNSLGVCYRDLGQMDSSDMIFNRFLQNKTSLAYHGWEGMITGNLGYNYYLRGEYDKAIPLILHDKNRALKDNDLSLAAGACTPLADIYIYQGRLEEAGKEIMDARLYIQLSQQNDRLRKLFPVMSKWYAKTGKGDLAIAYMDSTLIALKKYQEKKDALQLVRASQRNEIEKNKITVLKIQKEKERTIFIRNLVIITLIFTLLLLALFFQNRSKRHKQEQLIKDLKIQEHEIELARAGDQLVEFSRRITEKNELIERLEKETQLQENHHLLQELKQSAILTEEDWSRFKRIYEQVYPRFFDNLRDKFPELSPAETRYITLSKLGFNSNEVANCLGISKKSIHVTWHRIRKKLNLEESITVNDLANEVN